MNFEYLIEDVLLALLHLNLRNIENVKKPLYFELTQVSVHRLHFLLVLFYMQMLWLLRILTDHFNMILNKILLRLILGRLGNHMLVALLLEATIVVLDFDYSTVF